VPAGLDVGRPPRASESSVPLRTDEARSATRHRHARSPSTCRPSAQPSSCGPRPSCSRLGASRHRNPRGSVRRRSARGRRRAPVGTRCVGRLAAVAAGYGTARDLRWCRASRSQWTSSDVSASACPTPAVRDSAGPGWNGCQVGSLCASPYRCAIRASLCRTNRARYPAARGRRAASAEKRSLLRGAPRLSRRVSSGSSGTGDEAPGAARVHLLLASRKSPRQATG
jgi:hypothetical protein